MKNVLENWAKSKSMTRVGENKVHKLHLQLISYTENKHKMKSVFISSFPY